MSQAHKLLIAICMLAGTASAALAQSYSAGPIKVDQPWLRATPGGAKVGGGYVTITNTGTMPDRLLGVTLSQAARVEVHEMKMEGGTMKMREAKDGLEIGPGQKVELKPGGYHIMFMDLRAPFKQGDKLKGQLRFEKAGNLDVEFTVESIGAGAPATPKHSH
jgi:copper(I)-binding protein